MAYRSPTDWHFCSTPKRGEEEASFQSAESTLIQESTKELTVDREGLGAVGWHPEFGKVRLAELLSTWVVHDLTHLAQISRALAAQYRDAVGPWIRILSVLRAPAEHAVRAQSDRTHPATEA